MAPGDSPSAAENAAVRAVVFNHLAGLIVAPTVSALWERGALEVFTARSDLVEFGEIVARTHANPGYLRVALRILASCGWLTQVQTGESVAHILTREGRIAMTLAPALYSEVSSFFLPKALFLEDYLFSQSDQALVPLLRELVQRAKDRWRIGSHEDPVIADVRERVRRHLDGLLVGPVMVALARGGIVGELERGPVDLRELTARRPSLAYVFDLLANEGWVRLGQDGVELTRCGRYAAQIASAYGVTVSYLPLFMALNTLLFGNPRIPRIDENGFETLVNRAMNVWGSGGAHATYFKKVDEIIVEIFNRPLALQPRGICDMGCGDGTLLAHLYSVVKTRTVRGRELERHPLIIVGADFNKVARRASKQTLRRNGIPVFHVIHGDINRPAQLASDLEELGHDVHDLLHIRSFLDHNRGYVPLANYTRGTRTARSSGAFTHLGEEIPAEEVEENLVRHLRRWAPYISRFGLIVLELHTLPPELTAANLDRTPAVAYDGTHGYSDQYLVELPVFLDCAREAGLYSDPRFDCRFPSSELATVSLNFFTTSSFDTLRESDPRVSTNAELA
jgi:hypothetical protein